MDAAPWLKNYPADVPHEVHPEQYRSLTHPVSYTHLTLPTIYSV